MALHISNKFHLVADKVKAKLSCKPKGATTITTTTTNSRVDEATVKIESAEQRERLARRATRRERWAAKFSYLKRTAKHLDILLGMALWAIFEIAFEILCQIATIASFLLFLGDF